MHGQKTERELGPMGTVATALTIVLLLLPPAQASAQPSPRDKARAEVVEGAKLFEQGQFQAALARFQKAHAIFPSGKVFYNMALAYQGMGKAAEALLALGRFLRDPGDATPELLAESRALVDQLSRKVSFVSVSSNVDGAEIVLDGAPVGRTPAPNPLPVDPGPHGIILRSAASGNRSASFTAVAARPVELKLDFGGGANPTGPTAAKPQPPRGIDRPSGAAQAEALIREARDLRSAGKDARAYPLLQKAYEAETTPRTAAQLGLVEMQLGYWTRPSAISPKAFPPPETHGLRATGRRLEGSLVRVKAAIGEVTVTGSPPGATVSVNGWVAGTLPLAAPIRAGEGPLNVELRAAGFAPVTRSLTVVGGQRQEITVTMSSLSGSAGPATTPAGGGVENEAEGPSGLAATTRDLESTSRSRGVLRPIGWTAAVVGLGALGFGVFENLQWRRKLQQFEGYQAAPAVGQPASTPRECGAAERNRGAPGCDGIYRDMQRAKTLAVIGYAAAGLLTAGAITALLLSSGGDAPVEVACAPSPPLRGGGCRILF